MKVKVGHGGEEGLDKQKTYHCSVLQITMLSNIQ